MHKVNLCEACSKEKGVQDPTSFALADLLLGIGAAEEIEKGKNRLSNACDRRLLKRLEGRVAMYALKIAAVAAIISGSIILAYAMLGGSPAGLSEADRAEIVTVVGREVAGPVRSLTRNRDGTVQVFVGSGGELGGQLVRVARHKGAWRVVQRTLLF